MTKISDEQYALVDGIFGTSKRASANHFVESRNPVGFRRSLAEIKAIKAQEQVTKWMGKVGFSEQEAENAFVALTLKNNQYQDKNALWATNNVFEESTTNVDESILLAWMLLKKNFDSYKHSTSSDFTNEEDNVILKNLAPTALSHLLSRTPMDEIGVLFDEGWVSWDGLMIKMFTSRPSWGYQECKQLLEDVAGDNFFLKYRIACALFGESRYLVFDEETIDLLVKHGLLGVVYSEPLEKFAVRVKGMRAGLTRNQYINSLILGREWRNPILNLDDPRFDSRTFTSMFNYVMQQLTVDEEYYVQALYKEAIKADKANDFRAAVLCETQPVYGLAVVLKILSSIDLNALLSFDWAGNNPFDKNKTDKTQIPFLSPDGEFEIFDNLEDCLPAGLLKSYLTALLKADLNVRKIYTDMPGWLGLTFNMAFAEVTPGYVKDLMHDEQFLTAWHELDRKIQPARFNRYRIWFNNYNSHRDYYFDGELVQLLVDSSILDKFYLRELEAFWYLATGENVAGLPNDWILKMVHDIYGLGILTAAEEDPDDYM